MLVHVGTWVGVGMYMCWYVCRCEAIYVGVCEYVVSGYMCV